MNLEDLPGFVEHFRHRVLQDALLEATAAYWVRRAEQMEAGMPRPGDFTGQSTPEEIAERGRQRLALAHAFRMKARVMLGGDL